MPFKPIEPHDFPWFDYSRYTFSLGLRHDDHAYLSGHSASEYDPDGREIVVRGGMEEQTRTAYAKIERILGAADLGLRDVVRLVENVTPEGMAHYGEAERVRVDLFGDHDPVVNTVCVKRLLRPTAWIEIEVVAAAGGGRSLAADVVGSAPNHAIIREVGDVVYLPSCWPVNGEGEVVAEGDLVGQTEQCYRNAARLLESVGLDTSHIAKTVDYIDAGAVGDYKATGAVRRTYLSEPYPGATGIVMERLPLDGALIQIDIMASRSDLEAVNPGWERYGKLTYSPAVKAGIVLFMSGQAALDPATESAVHEGDIAKQAEHTYENIIRVLEAAGGGVEHLVKTVEYVTPSGLPEYREVARVRQRLLQEPWPASTGVVCGALLRPEFQIEIDPFAVLD